MPRQHLTPNACLVCRKKRTKCDGQIPCRRCRSRGEDCSYEDKKWRTKDHLRSEIERLRTEQRQGHAVLQALVDNNPEQWEVILDRMRAQDSPDAIADWIRSLVSLEPGSPSARGMLAESCGTSSLTRQFSSPLRGPMLGMPPVSSGELPFTCLQHLTGFNNPTGRLGVDTDYQPSLDQRAVSFDRSCRSSFASDLSSPDSPLLFRKLEPVFQQPAPALVISAAQSSTCSDLEISGSSSATVSNIHDGSLLRTWTNITSDVQLVHRLFSRFFSGLFPTLSLVSQSHFIEDFRNGNPRYCSEALVNAILGAACRLFGATCQVISRVSFGDAFVGEAKRLLAEEQNHVSLPSIQALGVLALAEICQGNDEEAENLVQESVRASVHLVLGTRQPDQDSEDFRVVKALAYCGVFSLMRVLRLLTGDLEPSTGPLFIRLHPDFGEMGEDTPQSRVERGIALQTQFCADLRYCPSLPRFVFEATEAVHTFLSYNHSRAMTAADLEGAYDRCLSYYRRFAESSAQALNNSPDMLFAQIWYHFCMLTLLRPFVTTSASLVDGVPPKLSNEATPSLVCQQASEAIISLTSTYQSRHSLSYLPPLLPYMVFTAVLYQLTLAANVPNLDHCHQVITESPAGLSPLQTYESPYPAPMPFGPINFGTHQPELHAKSPTFIIPARGAARRRASGPPSTSSSFSGKEQGRRPSSCSLMSGTTLDRDETSSPDTSSDMLPVFSSRPADLATVGTLQLASMGAQHAGAAEAARLLRGLEPFNEFSGSKLSSVSLSASLPIFAGGFGSSVMMTGLGLHVASESGVSPEMIDTACGGISRPGSISATKLDPDITSLQYGHSPQCPSPSGKHLSMSRI